MINYSGGAKGSDTAWEVLGKKHGVKTIAFSFNGHSCLSPNREIIDDEDLLEGWEKVLITSKKLNRYIGNSKPYIRKLLSRNWFQVKNSDSIFAIGRIVNPGERGSKYKNKTDRQVVDGGTGYAVSMAIDVGKPVYVFDQYQNKWFKWNVNKFIELDEIPLLTEKFTGIGTRNLNKNGIKAIEDIYSFYYEIKKGK